MKLKILLLLLIVVVISGCSIKENNDITDEEWNQFNKEYDWRDKSKKMTHTENHPSDFNCSTIAWIISNSVYPKEVSVYYNCTRYQTNISYGCASSHDPNTKKIYDDYYFRKCLTKT